MEQRESAVEKQMAEKRIRRSSIAGTIGCIFFGIGDWLLGWVEPGIVDRSFLLIREGHGADYSLMKVAVTLVLGIAGMVFLLPGYQGMAEIAADEKRKRRLRFTMALCAVGWLALHFTVAAGIWVYSWLMHQGMEELAVESVAGITKMLMPAQMAAYVFIYIPLIQMLVYILRRKTVYKRTAALAAPVLWMAVLGTAAGCMPASPFSTGMFAFCMNGAMMVWFVFCLIKKPVLDKQEEG